MLGSPPEDRLKLVTHFVESHAARLKVAEVVVLAGGIDDKLDHDGVLETFVTARHDALPSPAELRQLSRVARMPLKRFELAHLASHLEKRLAAGETAPLRFGRGDFEAVSAALAGNRARGELAAPIPETSRWSVQALRDTLRGMDHFREKFEAAKSFLGQHAARTTPKELVEIVNLAAPTPVHHSPRVDLVELYLRQRGYELQAGTSGMPRQGRLSGAELRMLADLVDQPALQHKLLDMASYSP
jgi:hypothetical protein